MEKCKNKNKKSYASISNRVLCVMDQRNSVLKNKGKLCMMLFEKEGYWTRKTLC